MQELTTSREADVLEECQEALGYRFRRLELLRAALTHTSGADTRLASNERLEFLGDAVLGALAAEEERPRVVKLAVRDLPHSGKPAELLAAAGIDAAAIEQAARELARVRVS